MLKNGEPIAHRPAAGGQHLGLKTILCQYFGTLIFLAEPTIRGVAEGYHEVLEKTVQLIEAE